jgi:hypothetical protein
MWLLGHVFNATNTRDAILTSAPGKKIYDQHVQAQISRKAELFLNDAKYGDARLPPSPRFEGFEGNQFPQH